MNPKVAKLMKQYQKEAIIILWEDFQPLVYTFMRKFYIHPNNRDDAKQDAFLQLLECANSYDSSTGVPFESYYKMNLHYQFLNRINKKTEALVVNHDWENGCSMTDLLESTMGNAPIEAEINERDPGACYMGRKESQDVLRIGQEVAKRVRRRGIIVDETRTHDVAVSLGERCRYENKRQYDYFISFHRNAYKPELANGAETYMYLNGGPKAYILAS